MLIGMTQWAHLFALCGAHNGSALPLPWKQPFLLCSLQKMLNRSPLNAWLDDGRARTNGGSPSLLPVRYSPRSTPSGPPSTMRPHGSCREPYRKAPEFPQTLPLSLSLLYCLPPTLPPPPTFQIPTQNTHRLNLPLLTTTNSLAPLHVLRRMQYLPLPQANPCPLPLRRPTIPALYLRTYLLPLILF